MSSTSDFTQPSDEFTMFRKKFTTEEDERLKMLVSRYGQSDWHKISREMPGRTGRQCRCRYNNYLMPGFINAKFTQDEDDLLVKMVESLGHKWTMIAHYFPGRSAGVLKNRWNFNLGPAIKKKNMTTTEFFVILMI